ncbi:hypothetical protein [Haloferax volcanii]|uniref:hypothetical protein n=1 Tax=Haloferax volcanii TaxID=2246 RepID=UPI0038547914
MSTLPETAYINHTSKVDLHEDVLADLYDKRIAGIHYGDFPSLNKQEWTDGLDDSTGGNAVGRLCEYAKDGRILTASYTGHPELSGGRLVGTVGPVEDNSDAEVLLIVCRNQERDGNERGIVDFLCLEPGAKQSIIESKIHTLNGEARDAVEQAIENEGFQQDEPEYRIVKGLEFNDDVAWVWNRDFPGLWAANKQQTIAGWVTGNTHLYAAYFAACSSGLDDMRAVNDRLPQENREKPVKLLSEGQLEVLCSEYLRRQYPGYFETLPVGGSLSGVDIVGESEETEILAQVTFTTDVEKKFRRLLSFANHSTTSESIDFYFFGPEEGKSKVYDETSSEVVDEVYMPIERVFRAFDTEDPDLVVSCQEQESPGYILNRLLEIDLSTDVPPQIG